MPTASDTELALTPEAFGLRARIIAWLRAHRRLAIAGALGIAALVLATVSLVFFRDDGDMRSWNIATTEAAVTLSPSDVANLDRRLAALKPGTPGFAARADAHMKLLSTIKLIDGRGGISLDQHLLRVIGVMRDEVRTADYNSGYDFAEQAFGLIDNEALRHIGARRLGTLTMLGRFDGPERLDRLFRTWATIDRGCLNAGQPCDGLTHDFSLYFSAYARINPDAEQAAFLLARRVVDPQRRASAYRQIGMLMMRPTMRVQNDPALLAAATAALKAKQGKKAIAAASALSMRPGSNRDSLLRLISDKLLKDQNIVDGLDAGLAIFDPGMRDTALLRVVNIASSKQYLHEAQVAQSKIGNTDQKTIAAMLTALAFAKGGYAAQAQPYLDNAVVAISAIAEGPTRDAAAAYGARAFAEADNLDAARQILKLVKYDSDLRNAAILSIADLYSRARDVKGMEGLAAEAQGTVAGEVLGRAAALAARVGDTGEAERIVGQASNDQTWLQAAGRLALGGGMPKAWIAEARAHFATLPTKDPALWDGLAFADAALLTGAGDMDRAVRRLPLIDDAGVRVDVAKRIGITFLNKGDYRSAMALLGQFTTRDTSNRDALKSALSLELGKMGAIRAAAYTAREMFDTSTRVRTFHLLARAQADKLDRFSALKGQPQPLIPNTGRDFQPRTEMERYIYATFDVKQQNLGDYLPRLPNSDVIDAASVRRNLPQSDNSGILDIVPLVNNDYNKKFLTARSVQDDWTLVGATIVMAAQSTRHPIYLHLSRGRVGLPQLWEQLILRGQGQYLQRAGRNYTLRAPLFVSDGATLILAGSDVEALRLSTERASFIVNAGDMRIADVTLVGWSEKNSAPTPMTFDSRHDFRPFYIAWSNSATRAVGSQFLNLGYAAGKAYGMTLTYGPVTLIQRNVEQIRPPTGTFVENSFQDMLYGFYSYEANDVQVVGNEYRNNIVYGIDPHDRSHKLLFSYNTVYGSHKKHGIIGSRNVEDSWFIGNLTFDNKGSGMMMDRYAGRNIMYGNTAFGNHSNGISIYESPCNIISSNAVFQNGRSGITVRNSWDVGIFHNSVNDNRNLGIEGYAIEFVTKPGQPARNLLLDPYEQFLSAAAVSNHLKNNKQGGMGMTGMGAMLLQDNTLIGSSKRMFLNDLRLAERDLSSRQATGVMVAGGCPKPKRPYSCPFIQQNYLSRELAQAPQSGKPFQSCPGKTIVNAATKQGAESFAPDRNREDDDSDPVPSTKQGAL